MTQLLVSVRSAAEAEAALAGGAALIDVKEPTGGSLGRAADAAIADVLRAVAGRRPVSAALGELLETSRDGLPASTADLAYVKWGLAGYRPQDPGPCWFELRRAAERVAARNSSCRVVTVAYADWRRAQAPAPEEVCAFALEHRTGPFLLDTWGKDGSSLLDWMPLPEVQRLCARCRSAGVPVALAGSLGPQEIRVLRPAQPDWFAVRGAACRQRRRGSAVDTGEVRQLVELLDEPVTADRREG
jgi:(5-formylfuran-3-yl)methyl phosphate synthase